MARKKPDPITDRARKLNDEIAALEAEIKKLDGQLAQPAPAGAPSAKPKWRTTLPPAPNSAKATEKPGHVPIFEEVPKQPLKAGVSGESPELFNELGVRKYDLPALFERIINHLRGPTTTNPRLVNYLAAGGVHGLRPLRYEKRVARNRFIFFTTTLFFILLGIILIFKKRH
jgi:hypothetical protein